MQEIAEEIDEILEDLLMNIVDENDNKIDKNQQQQLKIQSLKSKTLEKIIQIINESFPSM